MSHVDQAAFACRCEWGRHAIDALAPADVVIVVDVLSFSTCVDVAVSRGAAIAPYPYKDDSALAFATTHAAELAGGRGQDRYSLSPRSFVEVPSGLTCVLPSPNGAAVALTAAATGARVLAGCLRNAAATAATAAKLGTTFIVCAAGEKWPDGSLRPALEDWLGAGAILRALPGTKSPEARTAIAAFESARRELVRVLAECGSGRELIERGYAEDVELAASLNASAVAALYDGTAFRAHTNTRQ